LTKEGILIRIKNVRLKQNTEKIDILEKENIMRIDPHVHCRDGKQAYKATIKGVMELAKKQGVDIIFDMPNTDPPITRKEDVWERLRLVPKNKKENYFLWMGLTSDILQISRAVEAYNQIKEIIGFKLYAGKSVGNLAVIEPYKQMDIYYILKESNFRGVLAVHCEREDFLKYYLWDPSSPISHSMARPKEAEIQSVRDQIKFAEESGFKGTLHIVHVSCPESVELVKKAKQRGVKITCGVTPHHLMFSDEMQNQKKGLRYKMNPPLRVLEDKESLVRHLLEGNIDWIETDHAPHADEEKLGPPYLSGFPSLILYGALVNVSLLKMGASKKLIEDITCNNILRTFSEKLGGVK
jgi:dihydroorotase